MPRKNKLVIGSILLGIVGFSPMLLSLLGKGNKNNEVIVNPNYYNGTDEPLFKTKNSK